ncbi:MAG: FAD-dependent oxidoreductase [Ruminococcaceae bacterium]|nr:FAD-dependent oxidoreductase [Oscillospiraceae bacterium]
MNETYWKTTASKYPTLTDDIRCSCLVVGGGLCGVLTAYLLGKRGVDTVLIEKEHLGFGKTMGTTAKATVCHNMIYTRLEKSIGMEGARLYAEANLHGLRLLRELLLDDGAASRGDCQRSDFFLYSIYGERRIAAELRCMRECGILCSPINGRESRFELPLRIKSGILVKDQLQFPPLKAIHDIASRSNVGIYEETEAVSAIRSHAGYIVKTKNGQAIQASKVIVATNYPVLVPRNLSFIKLYRETSYAAALTGAPVLRSMYFGIDGGYAYRSHGSALIVSGERHRTSPVPNAADRLLEEAKAMFGEVTPLCSWSNNDCYTHDGIPYIGKTGDGLYIASGFNGWGMTNSASAALILSYLAVGENLPFAGIFSPSRNIIKSGGESLAHHISISAAGMAKNLTVPELTAADIRPGCAGIVSHNGKRTGAYRDNEGKLHLVSLKCPHLGCSIAWNPAAKTWDCPCHGSRFTPDGICISEPSTQNSCVEKTSAE